MHFTKSSLLNLAQLKLALQSAASPIRLFKEAKASALTSITEHHQNGTSAADIVKNYTWVIDKLVILAWKQHIGNCDKSIAIELVAVGGYGRNELHPHSDIDLLILLRDNQYQEASHFIESFLSFLWDIGLNVGHSVRSHKDCLKEARHDITVMTNLLEARHLTGDDSLLVNLDTKLRNSRIWPADKFFTGKLEEQKQRHGTYQDTAYSLEPNIKDSPGGMRDLQTILWIYNRHFGTRTFREMKQQGHINDDEYRILIRARNVLWKIRLSLHINTKRHEDRLLFDNQRQLAKEFGYEDTKNHLAVEQLMKRYYRTVKQIRFLNEILLSHYRVNHNRGFSLAVARNLDDDFILKSKLIEQRDETLFSHQPQAMLKLFVLMQEHKITGIHPDTIRSIRANLGKINNKFRADPENKKLFLQLFKSEDIGLTNALARMNTYGLLGAYLPTFGAIVGQMQHDLFHVYTVDAHTLMVIKNLTRLRKYKDEYPIASHILDSLYKPERLFLSALFHDIAKGRGGDHSVLGEAEAEKFCLQHAMSEYDAKLVAWLVRNHLIMSHFSQRRDISDPMVVNEFADIVGDIEHLDNLYLLTMADIRGTSPKVWSAWKGQLLLDLYKATNKALSKGVAKPINEAEHVIDDKQSAIKKLAEQLPEGSYDIELVEQFWDTLPNDYFIRNEPTYIAWHAASLCQNPSISIPIVSVRYSERRQINMFFVFAPESKALLSQVTASFDAMEINIIEAQLQSSLSGFALYTFKAIVPEFESGEDAGYMTFLEVNLRKRILSQKELKVISRRKASRALKHFPIQAHVAFTFNNQSHTAMEVVAQDQPGLLHNVALILKRHKVKLVSAKIATFGEKAEDIFFIQLHDQTPVTEPTLLEALNSDITNALEHQDTKTGNKSGSKSKKIA